MKRARHLPTVALPNSRRSAIVLLASPSALLKTMRARALNEAGSERLRANEVSCVRSSSVITKSAFGLPLVIAVSPSQRYRRGTHYLCLLLTGRDTSYAPSRRRRGSAGEGKPAYKRRIGRLR